MSHATQNVVKSVHNNTDLIKQISLFDTVLVMTNTKEFFFYKYLKKIGAGVLSLGLVLFSMVG